MMAADRCDVIQLDSGASVVAPGGDATLQEIVTATVPGGFLSRPGAARIYRARGASWPNGGFGIAAVEAQPRPDVVGSTRAG